MPRSDLVNTRRRSPTLIRLIRLQIPITPAPIMSRGPGTSLVNTEAIADLIRLSASILTTPPSTSAGLEPNSALANSAKRSPTMIRPCDWSPTALTIYVNRGLMKSNLGQFREAIADYDQALRLDPDDVRAYVSRAASQIQTWSIRGGLRRLRSGHPTGARRRTVGAYTSRGNVKFDLGYAKFELDQYREAIADLDRAIHCSPMTPPPTKSEGCTA